MKIVIHKEIRWLWGWLWFEIRSSIKFILYVLNQSRINERQEQLKWKWDRNH